VTNFLRPSAPSCSGAQPSSAHLTLRRLLHLTTLIAAAAVVLLATAPRAAAIVTEIETGAGKFKVGLEPRVQKQYALTGFKATKLAETPYLTGPEPALFANPSGHDVLHGVNTWAIFWDPEKYFYHGDWQELISNYFADAAGASGSLASVFSVDAQYTDKSNRPASYQETFRGSSEDTKPYPASGCTDPEPLPLKLIESGEVPPTRCLTNEQVEGALESYIKTQGLPSGMNNVYFLMTPPGITICLDGGGASGHCSDYTGT
jgi:hypothetical protein